MLKFHWKVLPFEPRIYQIQPKNAGYEPIQLTPIISFRWTSVQKRCLKLLFPSLSYSESLVEAGLERLDDRRDSITEKIFRQIKDPKYPLHYLIPPAKTSHSQMVLRPSYPYQVPLSKTVRYTRDFVPFCISKKFWVVIRDHSQICSLFVFVIVLFVILLGLLSDMLFVYCIVAFQPLVAN